MKELREDDIYSWMNQQIKAYKIQDKELQFGDDDIYDVICIAGHYSEKEIHVYKIRKLAELIGVECEVEPFNEDMDTHYFWYKGYKFFGLVNKEEKK